MKASSSKPDISGGRSLAKARANKKGSPHERKTKRRVWAQLDGNSYPIETAGRGFSYPQGEPPKELLRKQ